MSVSLFLTREPILGLPNRSLSIVQVRGRRSQDASLFPTLATIQALLRIRAKITESDRMFGACGCMTRAGVVPCGVRGDYRWWHDRPGRNRAKVAGGRLEAGRAGSESVCCQRGASGRSRRCCHGLGDHGACPLDNRARTKRTRHAVATARPCASRRWRFSAVDGA